MTVGEGASDFHKGCDLCKDGRIQANELWRISTYLASAQGVVSVVGTAELNVCHFFSSHSSLLAS